jgi:hypothetical protein
MSNKHFLMACALLVASGTGAMAASPYPESIVGTWSMSANQSTLTLTISRQTGPAACKSVTGTLVDSVNGPSDIEGFYCPASGRLSFLREDTVHKRTYQTFPGNVSYPGDTTYMAGIFAQAVGTTPGEYDFFASLNPPT